MKWSVISLLLIFCMGAFLLVAGCSETSPGGALRPGWLPAGKNTTPASAVTTTQPSVTVVTPFATTVPTTQGLASPTFRNPPTTATPATTYTKIYENTFTFDYNDTAFAYELTTPPLIIDYTVIPEMITEEKLVTSQYGSKDTVTVRTTHPSEYSWFEITIRDRNTGNILIQDGFGKAYNNWIPDKQLMIRNYGTYQIELRGGMNTRVSFMMRVGE